MTKHSTKLGLETLPLLQEEKKNLSPRSVTSLVGAEPETAQNHQKDTFLVSESLRSHSLTFLTVQSSRSHQPPASPVSKQRQRRVKKRTNSPTPMSFSHTHAICLLSWISHMYSLTCVRFVISNLHEIQALFESGRITNWSNAN